MPIERGHRAQPARSDGFRTAPFPPDYFFIREHDQSASHFQPKRDILHGGIMPRNCPTCKKPLTRIRRKLWMRCIPGSKQYVCRKCGSAYLLIFKCWLLKRRQTDQKTASPQGS